MRIINIYQGDNGNQCNIFHGDNKHKCNMFWGENKYKCDICNPLQENLAKVGNSNLALHHLKEKNQKF